MPCEPNGVYVTLLIPLLGCSGGPMGVNGALVMPALGGPHDDLGAQGVALGAQGVDITLVIRPWAP